MPEQWGINVSVNELPRVLCVDDEPRVVEGIALQLRKEYEVHSAFSAEEALRKLREVKGIAVVLSDMRMPGTDGAALLERVHQLYPRITRILLTGEPGRDVAVQAVNRGQIFRYLTKPCQAEELRAAIEAGLDQYRLLNAERAVLQETLLGLIAALVDMLAITNPVAFGRARRLKTIAMAFAKSLGHEEFWQLEAAAMLSQIGYISLPVELSEKIYYGESLTPEEKVLAGGVDRVSEQLLEHVPRLEPVMQVLMALKWTDEQIARLGEGTIGLATRILGLTMEYDTQVIRGVAADEAVHRLRSSTARFGQELTEQFARHVGTLTGGTEVRELALKMVKPGMTILADVRTQLGTLLVPRGFEVTARFLDKIAHFGADMLEKRVPVRVSDRLP
jgi:response regulator RpfG family c-di-GMP phosphodiesterase